MYALGIDLGTTFTAAATWRNGHAEIASLGSRATLKLFEEADHSFHVPAKTGRKDADVRREMLDALAAWTRALA